MISYSLLILVLQFGRALGGARVDGQPDREGSAFAGRAADVNLAEMLIDDGPHDGQTLAGALADRLGREKGIEDPMTQALGNTAPGVRDSHTDCARLRTRGDLDRPPAATGRLDGMRSVHDQVEKRLVEITDVTPDTRQLV